jgi:hypothetical protein
MHQRKEGNTTRGHMFNNTLILYFFNGLFKKSLLIMGFPPCVLSLQTCLMSKNVVEREELDINILADSIEQFFI